MAGNPRVSDQKLPMVDLLPVGPTQQDRSPHPAAKPLRPILIVRGGKVWLRFRLRSSKTPRIACFTRSYPMILSPANTWPPIDPAGNYSRRMRDEHVGLIRPTAPVCTQMWLVRIDFLTARGL